MTRHPTAGDEVIHTTANHPWLTADHGWLVAGALPGAGPMWDLSLRNVHTFALGGIQAVVHNSGGKRVVGEPSAVENNLDGNAYFHYTNKEGYEGIMNDSGAMLAQN